MHSPRPYGLLVVNGKLSEQDRLFIDHQLKKLSNQKALSNLDSIRQVRDLPDGGYVILQDMAGILKAIAHKELDPYAFENDGLAKLYVPMLFSGVITKARVLQNEGVGIKLTEQCRQRLSDYKNNDIPNKDLKLQRFTIEPNMSVVPEFYPKSALISDIVTTQYSQQRPTWYSGAMAEVMQIVGGYGKLNFQDLPDKTYDRKQFNIPPEYIDRISEELYGVRLPGYIGIPSIDGEFQYNYKFNQTHGITFDNSNKPWLTRIGSSGIYAMPLPLIPTTTTSAFREYIEKVGDQEILNILDRFGGMPSGESFPKGSGFESWRRAGVIIKVSDTNDFYSNIAYSMACGWSFNLSGTEGFNTCYNYDEDGVAVGKAYKLKLSFSNAKDNGWLKAIEVKEEYRTTISTYLSKLFALLGKDDKSNAILYKLRRVSQDDIFFQAETSLYNPLGVTSVDVDYWDNLELDPIAVLSGNVNQVGQGYLFPSGAEIKFPSVELQGCISFDFSVLDKSKIPPGHIVRCDTIMYGYYIGDSLKVVKYFLDQRKYALDVENDFEECMTVGSWTQTVYEGQISVWGNFYTTDFDRRNEFAPTQTVTKIKGEDRGFDSKPVFSFDDFFSQVGSIWRNRYFTHKSESTKTEDRSINIAVCIPFLCRNASLYAVSEYVSGIYKTEGLSLHSVRDPNSYRYFTYDFIWAWVGGSIQGNMYTASKAEPYPKNGNPVWVMGYNYYPGGCSDFADQGDWLGGLPYDITWLVHPDKHTWQHSGGGGAPKVQTYSKSWREDGKTTGNIYITIDDVPRKIDVIPATTYFLPSPDLYVGVFYRDACKVVFGDSEYANISESDQNNRRFKWGYCSLVEDKSAYHFIGVINE
ncbi:hypothetical protein ACG92Y_02705 [Acinetobacter ursingii]|uniref:hypothetical protein n=1 Tax=Acinetobacter ursingii TaxID=108980 RepID=UPI003AF98FB4